MLTYGEVSQSQLLNIAACLLKVEKLEGQSSNGRDDHIWRYVTLCHVMTLSSNYPILAYMLQIQ